MDKNIKLIYLWSIRDKLNIDEMEKKCLDNMFARRSIIESSTAHILFDGYGTHFVSNATPVDEEKDTLRILMRYRRG